MSTEAPYLSVIVPVHGSAPCAERCLCAIRGSRHTAFELLVGADRVDPAALAMLGRYADRVATVPSRRGPAAARNAAAAVARGAVLLFVDSDVEVRDDTLARVAACMLNEPRPDALFGSYDDAPAARNFASLFKNLLHHFVHQSAHERARTFWTGCGAVRADLFRQAGGFPETYEEPSIEDVVLGYTLAEAGADIRLVKDLQVKHLKRWTVGSVIRCDVRNRAVPWTRLALAHGLPYDLNFRVADRLSALLCWILAATLVVGVRAAAGFAAAAGLIACLVVLNARLYAFFLRRCGVFFTVRAAAFHWLYFLYSSATFAAGLLLFHPRRNRADMSGNRAGNAGVP